MTELVTGRGLDGRGRCSDGPDSASTNVRGVALGSPLAFVRGVPSQLHEVLVEMFRSRPELARELLWACASMRLVEGNCEAASIDLSQAVPSEYRADAVTVVRGADGQVNAAVVVEVQLAIDREKVWTWPVYIAALRARLRCPVVLFVMARNEVKDWAGRAIELGHPGFTLTPIVAGLSEIPRITQPAQAARSPELAVLSVFGHPEVVVGYAATQGIAGLPEDVRKLYFDLILIALPRHARRLLEAMMIKGYQYQSEFARHYVAEGREEGRELGRQEGREEARGLLCEEAIRIASERVGSLSPEQERRIRAAADIRVLTELIAGFVDLSDSDGLDALLTRLTTR